MGRKAFIADLEDAATPGRFEQIIAVKSGDDDGALQFIYQGTDRPVGDIAIVAMVSDVYDYPSDHSYIVFTTTDGVPDAVTTAIESVQRSGAGQNIAQMLLEVSCAIEHALSASSGSMRPDIGSIPSRSEESEEDAFSGDDEDDADFTSDSSPVRAQQLYPLKHDDPTRHSRNPVSDGKICSDILVVKKAGFKAGILGHPETGGVLCVSIRIFKLGISEEAMKAWSLTRDRYLVLLIRYRSGYKDIADLVEDFATTSSTMTSSGTEFRVALCKKYKPSLAEALNAFNTTYNVLNDGETTRAEVDGALEPLFIDWSLNHLLGRLPTILKYRLTYPCSWTQAEHFLHQAQAQALSSLVLDAESIAVPDNAAPRALPTVVNADHIAESTGHQAVSLPLAAMQFVLRHLVRCTEFCLICHCEIDTNFEALKPYVCSKPLCLYQYLNLGIGPGVEWEILSQPYVVDLLVSLCYCSAHEGRLQEFPIGIGLTIPLLPGATTRLSTATELGTKLSKLDFATRHLTLLGEAASQPLKLGDWVAVRRDGMGTYHARVEDGLHPNLQLSELIYVAKPNPVAQTGMNSTKSTPLSGSLDVEVFPYTHSFDELPDSGKQTTIAYILETLPGVMQMQTLIKSHSQNAPLSRFPSKISSAALDLLRWIISSNRSCILQVDQTSPSESSAGSEDCVSGMKGWMQFRFAQGAPDKEQRFMDCVNSASVRLEQGQYPTIFAWHGSYLRNWHSIIREGLHFRDTLHGRAMGDGVYMSPLAATSLGYCEHRSSAISSFMAIGTEGWRNSKLCVSSVLALNEVVNAPEEFVSRAPHYVVDQIDWIQTRYLFVRCSQWEVAPSKGPRRVLEQDPRRTAIDPSGIPILIPVTAVCRSRRPAEVSHPQPQGIEKPANIGTTSQTQADNAEDDAASIATDASDLELLFPQDTDGESSTTVLVGAPISSNQAKGNRHTDFVPDTLEASTLHLLAPPANASIGATRTLMTALKQTLSIQDSSPLHELGWYISHPLITNIYQWPIELHSFPTTIPLSSDMSAAGLKSIVLEMRFGTNFPMSPPFVRVIRPRFLPFMLGGGGHVTGGGALCMELLTNSGWSAASSLESVLMQVRMAICSTDPHPARLAAVVSANPNNNNKGGRKRDWDTASLADGVYQNPINGGEYGIGEAITAFKRACQLHGWQIPRELDEFLVAS